MEMIHEQKFVEMIHGQYNYYGNEQWYDGNEKHYGMAGNEN